MDRGEGRHHRGDRGPLLIISGGNDNTAQCAIANASYRKRPRVA
ncbi:hypothetical protein [Streptomyces sp. YS415]|nr:hypothetical protein [Streptomyces sp. YS415]